jgi:hypothetical protein
MDVQQSHQTRDCNDSVGPGIPSYLATCGLVTLLRHSV